MSTPLLPRQQQKLIKEILQSPDSLFFVIIYETQSIDEIVKILTGVTMSSYEMKKEGVARFRLSNYLPTGERLIDGLKEVVPVCDWIILHTGCSICPEIVLEFFQYLDKQRFSKPRIVVVGEQIDVSSGDRRMRELFMLGRLVNLVAGEI